jgi:predicted ABC-type ATPase
LLRENVLTKTVFTDPIGDKLTSLREAAATGYTVVLCFIGISWPAVSEERVAMRVCLSSAIPDSLLKMLQPTSAF